MFICLINDDQKKLNGIFLECAWFASPVIVELFEGIYMYKLDYKDYQDYQDL